jgi:hypothetical protein
VSSAALAARDEKERNASKRMLGNEYRDFYLLEYTRGLPQAAESASILVLSLPSRKSCHPTTTRISLSNFVLSRSIDSHVTNTPDYHVQGRSEAYLQPCGQRIKCTFPTEQVQGLLGHATTPVNQRKLEPPTLAHVYVTKVIVKRLVRHMIV